MSPNSKISDPSSQSPKITSDSFVRPGAEENSSLATSAAAVSSSSYEDSSVNPHNPPAMNGTHTKQQSETDRNAESAPYSSVDASPNKREHSRRNLSSNSTQQPASVAAERSIKNPDSAQISTKRIRLSASNKNSHPSITSASDDNGEEGEAYAESGVNDDNHDSFVSPAGMIKKTPSTNLNYGSTHNSLTETANLCTTEHTNNSMEQKEHTDEIQMPEAAPSVPDADESESSHEASDSAASHSKRARRSTGNDAQPTVSANSSGLLSKDYKNLKQKLINERIAAINCELEALENGVHPELAVRLQAIEKKRDSRLKIAENRKSYETKSILEAFLCSATEANDNFTAALKELQNAYLSRRERQTRTRRKRLILLYKKHQKSHLTEEEALLMNPNRPDASIKESANDYYLVYREGIPHNSLTYDLTLIKDE